ncbi:hypothetical protein GSI_10387 [Ganoderma sinense ZZ0214-1]|uniref:Uncharacterized protein n=1 Tax=Ganoderma sinense ZZ0214-1 TaxID=1077348 RepID=A0A2G8S0D8_9APHY|nr:hypothetical protein GSI_10387 [Ganoderma sinense ZZ0214-1]
MSVEETPQKTPEKCVVKDKQPAHAQVPWSIDFKADARRPNSRLSVIRTPKPDRTCGDDMDVVSSESPSLRTLEEEEENDDSEQEHPSPTKKPHQHSPEIEYKPTPKTSKTPKGAIRAMGFEKAEVGPDSASDFFNKSPVKSSKKGQNLFVDKKSGHTNKIAYSKTYYY